jgi:hypothetical protein
MAGSFRTCTVVGSTLIGASPIAMFFVDQELVEHVGLVHRWAGLNQVVDRVESRGFRTALCSSSS